MKQGWRYADLSRISITETGLLYTASWGCIGFQGGEMLKGGLIHNVVPCVALCDITSDKAILWVAPETHKAGDVCIFDRNTYHRSLMYETNEDRYAYAAQYMAEYSRMAETSKKRPSPNARARVAGTLEAATRILKSPEAGLRSKDSVPFIFCLSVSGLWSGSFQDSGANHLHRWHRELT